MAEYWVSQAKKYCDFCKCWIADNKPSVQFHESGKKHKQNVANKIKEIGRKSAKTQKENERMDEDMKRMEQQALKAYLKDVESNPDYTCQMLKEMKRKKIEEEGEKKQVILEVKAETTASTDHNRGNSGSNEGINGGRNKDSVSWYEGKSPEGYSYYWNIHTGESKWEPPSEGFVPLCMQNISPIKEENDTEGDAQRASLPVIQKNLKKEPPKPIKEEKEPELGTPQKPVIIGPAEKHDPYGKWETVNRSIPEPINYELPKQEYIAIKVPSVKEKGPKILFKEKTVESINGKHSMQDEADSVQFKKPRIAKTNMRSRTED